MSKEEVEKKYNQYRSELYQAMNLALENSDLYVTEITDEALDISMSWDNLWHPSNWERELTIHRQTKPKRIEVALWRSHPEGDQLIAASLGHPTRHGTGLRLNLIQAAPKNIRGKQKVFPTIETAYELYASMLNCGHIRIVNPMKIQLVNYYCENSFSKLHHNPEHKYQVKKVSK